MIQATIEFEAVSVSRKVGLGDGVDGISIVQAVALIVNLFNHAVVSAISPEIAVIVLWTPRDF